MRKGFVLLLLILSIPRVLLAQYYISLDKSNTFHFGNSYLIDIPLRQARMSLLIKDSTGIIPLQAYSEFWHEGDHNVNFVDRYNFSSIFITELINTKMPVKKRVATHNYGFNEYIIKYYPKGSIDTLNGLDDTLTRYIPLLTRLKGANEFKKDSILIYYSEFRGSVCCPRDPRYDKISLTDFIEAFEKIHQVKIGDSFYVSLGKEGESGEFLTLSGLTSEQKIEFIDERNDSLLSNKKDLKQPTIYTPYWVPIKTLKYSYLKDMEDNQNNHSK